MKNGEKMTSFKDPKTGKTWAITSNLNCQSKNVIYVVACVKCPMWGPYGGETEREFCQRLTEHRGAVTRKENTAVGRHFNQKGHSIKDMRAFAIEQIKSDNPRIRKRREQLWIYRLDSIASGANIREQN